MARGKRPTLEEKLVKTNEEIEVMESALEKLKFLKDTRPPPFIVISSALPQLKSEKTIPYEFSTTIFEKKSWQELKTNPWRAPRTSIPMPLFLSEWLKVQPTTEP